MRFPRGLAGGGEFLAPFRPVPVAAAQVWRKCGPVDALKIERVVMREHLGYDDGLPGVVCRFSHMVGGSLRWSRRFFFPARDEADFHRLMRESGRALC